MQESFEQPTALQALACAPGTVLHARYRITQALRLRGDDLHYAAEDLQTGKQVLVTEYVPQSLVFRRDGTLYCRSEEAKTALRQEVGRRLTFYRRLLPISQSTVLDLTDVFLQGGTCCTVSQTNGTPLSAMIGSGNRLPAARALALLAPVTDCLRAMHAAGLFHGAVDPYHILTDGKRVTALTGLAYPPVPASTPFDAPEKNAGLYECSAATDVYAMGAVLYQLLTGFPPESAAQRQRGRALTLPEDLPPRVRDALSKALAQDPHDRFADADQLLAALEETPAAEPQKKKRDGREILRRVVMCAAILTLVISLGVLINYYILAPNRAIRQAKSLAELLVTQAEETEDPWPAIRAKYPDVAFPAGMNPSFADLYALNKDLAGWISIPALDINFPVLQTDDNDYYLRRDFYGKSTAYGNPFFDFRNHLDTLDRNTVLYGHNMRHDDKLFGTLERFRDPATFVESPLIGLSTLYADYTFKVCAVFVTNSVAADDHGDIFNYIFTETDADGFRRYLSELNKRKLYDTGVGIDLNDRLLTLSTCCYDFSNARLVIVARLLRTGESAAIDPAAVQVNERPKYPQAYYDANRMDNPFLGDEDLFPMD